MLAKSYRGKRYGEKAKNKYPYSNIVAVDYDPSATKVNQENRLKLMLSNARLNETFLKENRKKQIKLSQNKLPMHAIKHIINSKYIVYLLFLFYTIYCKINTDGKKRRNAMVHIGNSWDVLLKDEFQKEYYQKTSYISGK